LSAVPSTALRPSDTTGRPHRVRVVARRPGDGTASAFGRASAIALPARGLHVVIADLDPDGGRRVVEELPGPAGLAVRAGLSPATDVADLVDATRPEFERLDEMLIDAAVQRSGAVTEFARRTGT
jgi:NAD(P)-dependent dehydrogenase (short-subunit alcohol dehydrogenase family)